MTRRFLHNCELLDPEAAAPRRGAVLVDRGRIEAVLEAGEPCPEDAEPVDLGALSLAPGFIDIHFHGELIFAPDTELPAAFERTAKGMLAGGTTAYLATTVTWGEARNESFLTQAECEMTLARQGGASCLGVHLEGPWINPDAAGAQPRNHVRPYDAAEGREILARGRDLVKIVTLA
ncbi:MAG: amidohydrolase family protein, partial [bacterium]|nr:amidohydrolase family protein [bacterium]